MSRSDLNLRVLIRTSTFQFAVIYAALFAVSVLVLVGVLYWWTIGDLNSEVDATIEAEITGLAEQYEELGTDGLISVITERSGQDSDQSSVYLLVDENLQRLAGNLDAWPVSLTRKGRWLEFEHPVAAGGAVPVRAMVQEFSRNLSLLVGRDVSDQVHLNRAFKRAVSLAIAIGLVLALAGGLLMSLGAQRRVSAISRTARQIMEGDLSQRIVLSGTHDQYDQLAVQINAMLDQIESLLESMRHVGDSIAHDLRMPLTRLRNRLEQLAVGDHGNQDGLKQCVGESDRLLATFNALLRISRIESGAYRAAFSEFDLAEMARDICDIYQPAADDRKITLRCRCEKPVGLYGDRELLAQALTNLLDNAIKYTPKTGEVTVTTRTEDGRCNLVVADSGPGVPEEQISKLQQRFVRLDAARSEAGDGLGLALVAAVVEQHRGNLVIRNRQPGLEVCMDLPASPRRSE